MRLLLLKALSLALLVAAAWVPPLHAEWTLGGSVISTFPEVVVGSDGRGGVFASNNPGRPFPLLYHLDSQGSASGGWPAGDIELTPGMTVSQHTSIRALAMLPDGDGGVFVLTREKSPYLGHGGFWNPDQYYLHRRTADGRAAPSWALEGVLLETPYLDPRYVGLHLPRMAPDGTGGVLVSWLATGLVDYPNPRVVVQRVTATGARMWGDDGITVRSRAGACTIPAVVGDSGGGALVFWGQWDANGKSIQISGQHIDASGRALWDTEGRAVSTASYNQIVDAIPADGGWVWANYRTAIAATSDGKSGAILTWAGARDADLNIIAARIGPDGFAPWGHDVTVCAAPSWQATVDCASWQDGGALIAWRDGRAGADVGIYAQAIDHDGRARWTTDGIALALGRGDRGPALAVTDGHAGTYLAWLEPSDSGRVVAQRLLHSGRPAPGWADGGLRVSRFAEPDYGGSVGLSMVGSVAGTAHVAWTSWRRGSYVMLLTPHGLAVQDVPGRKRGAMPLADLSPEAVGAPFAIHGIRPNPMTVGAVVHLALPGPSDALLEMFDLTGRRVWSRDLSGLGAGEHEVPVGDGRRLPVGLYLIRLSQAGKAIQARAIVVQ